VGIKHLSLYAHSSLTGMGKDVADGGPAGSPNCGLRLPARGRVEAEGEQDQRQIGIKHLSLYAIFSAGMPRAIMCRLKSGN
jgi:hypothetical protein